MERMPIIGVVGGGRSAVPEGSKTYNLAKELGELIAKRNAVVLCGGRDGVMEAVARGAKQVGGHTIGIMPSVEGSGKPNQYIDFPVFTGLRDARNYVNAFTSDVLIGMEGGPGTLSEIALAMKLNRHVICLQYWGFLVGQEYPLEYTDKADDAVKMALKFIVNNSDKTVKRSEVYPNLPGQDDQRRKFEQFIASLSKQK